MSWRRFSTVALDELRLTLKRPMVWVLLGLFAFMAYGLSAGWVQIGLSTGDAGVGGKKAFLTSEFALSQVIAVFCWSISTFFVAAAAGLAVIRDDEAKVLEVLHATPLKPAEYGWGKYVGVLSAFLVVLAALLAMLVFCLQVLPNAEMLETRGPFAIGNYLKPALLFGVTAMVFNTALAFSVGTGFRKAITVFALPVGVMLFCALFLWTWSPAWLSEGANRALMFGDPSGLRWLRETWLTVDRGATFYNTQPLQLDGVMRWSRLLWMALSLGGVWWSVARYGRRVRASHRVAADVVSQALAMPAAPAAVVRAESAGVLGRGAVASPTWWTTMWSVARAESKELASTPGLYLFVPLILIQVIATSILALGAFDTPLLRTPGQLANTQMQLITAYVTLLLMFYAVESLERERGTRLNAIHDVLPIATGAMLVGKGLALGVVIAVIVGVCLVASAILLLVQGTVAFSITPFALLWVGLLLPTFFVVVGYVFAAYGLARSRYGAYGLTLAAIAVTVWAGLTERDSWVSDWSLSSAIVWSDMSVLEFDRRALVYNRLLWIALGVVLWRLAVRWYPRVEHDGVRRNTAAAAGGRRPSWWRRAWPAVPYLVGPLVFGSLAWREVNAGPDGSRAKKQGKDYWKKNLATWHRAKLPWVKNVELDITLEPEARWMKVVGSYLLVNRGDSALGTIPLTVGNFDSVSFTAHGDSIAPDTASRLFLFTLKTPLAGGDSVRLGFRYVRRERGATRDGGGAGEFLLPSGVVMQGWSPRYFPTLGFQPDIGVDEDNSVEAREYDNTYWQATTPPLFGAAMPMTVTTRLDVPEAFVANGVGERLSEEVKAGRRVTVFKSDEPVMAFNVVAGRWQVKRGQGTALYYHAAHTYNVDEISATMDGARKYYGEWFGAYPWKELKISEFPAMATYAQGFPTNITFSEDIGFLTKSEPKTNLATLVAAHEIAHQWWGNMLQPGEGPGANILSEGMSHFSTTLLISQLKGVRSELEFRKRMETRYGENRFRDAERELYRIDGSRDGDNTVTYDKGGWVFWMLQDLMGRESALAGMRAFIAKYRVNEDHPVLQDFTAHMRGYARDTAAYDDFVRQWFDTVVVPEYKVDSAVVVARGGRWVTRALVRNVGSGVLAVDVAVVRGERFPDATGRAGKQRGDMGCGGAPPPGKVMPDSTKTVIDSSPEEPNRCGYRQAVINLVVPADSAGKWVTIDSDFAPEKVVVDPDVRVLQLRRPSAERKVKA